VECQYYSYSWLLLINILISTQNRRILIHIILNSFWKYRLLFKHCNYINCFRRNYNNHLKVLDKTNKKDWHKIAHNYKFLLKNKIPEKVISHIILCCVGNRMSSITTNYRVSSRYTSIPNHPVQYYITSLELYYIVPTRSMLNDSRRIKYF